jgi:hypothetical protein
MSGRCPRCCGAFSFAVQRTVLVRPAQDSDHRILRAPTLAVGLRSLAKRRLWGRPWASDHELKRNPMGTLRTFFQQLSRWEHKPVIRLAANWSPKDRKAITVDVKQAVDTSGLARSAFALPPAITTQAMGNHFADVFCERLGPHLRQYQIEGCDGPGYPDRRLVRSKDGRAFVLELKLTRDFDPRDGNRLVLTSNSDKLRRHFHGPVRHLLVTVCYRRSRGRIRVRFVRLDFLQPSTPVHVRLEASITKRILSAQRNGCVLIRGADKEFSPAPGKARRRRKHTRAKR